MERVTREILKERVTRGKQNGFHAEESSLIFFDGSVSGETTSFADAT
jgi:hypothetical protein